MYSFNTIQYMYESDNVPMCISWPSRFVTYLNVQIRAIVLDRRDGLLYRVRSPQYLPSLVFDGWWVESMLVHILIRIAIKLFWSWWNAIWGLSSKFCANSTNILMLVSTVVSFDWKANPIFAQYGSIVESSLTCVLVKTYNTQYIQPSGNRSLCTELGSI